MDDLCFMPATEAAALIREKKLSPVELTSAVLARIEALEGEEAEGAEASTTADE